MDIQNMNGIEYLVTVEDNSIDFIIIDPPYITSKEQIVILKNDRLLKKQVLSLSKLKECSVNRNFKDKFSVF